MHRYFHTVQVATIGDLALTASLQSEDIEIDKV